MKLSKKSEYACLALIDMAENYQNGYVKMQDIASRKEIPKKYLEQILLQLKGAGIVTSLSGSAGGYTLARKPENVCLAEVIRLIDGPLASVRSASKYFYEHTPVEQNEKLLSVFKEIRDYVSDKLESTTIKDLL